jgi:uncharacterized protein YgbK (DUF1537 family)
MLLGCIADDLTGATDLSLMLTREGLRTVQSTGMPTTDIDLSSTDALVVALKSRTIPASEAVAQSLSAAGQLRQLGAQRLLFKYCSTFDSTDHGNIGPVAAALLDFAGGTQTIACPAFPRAGRQIFNGHLFVNGVLLSDSPMKDHPLTPMRDANLCRVLQRQTGLPVGLVSFADVDAGIEMVRQGLAREVAAGHRIQIVDAVTDDHLRSIGAAVADFPLLTGGSGIAMGLPAAYLTRGLIDQLFSVPTTMQAASGRRAILAGSCSAATREQVATAIAQGIAAFQIDPIDLSDGRLTVEAILTWIDAQSGDRPVLVYSSADPDIVRQVQDRLGRDAAGAAIEHLLAQVAQGLVTRGFNRLLIAGGETSGAVVQALGAGALSIGPEIDPGVPWTRSLSGPDVALALKSGNFGAPDFFLKAWEKLT